MQVVRHRRRTRFGKVPDRLSQEENEADNHGGGWDPDLLPERCLIEGKKWVCRTPLITLDRMVSERGRAGNKKVAVLRIGDLSSDLKTLLKYYLTASK